MMHLTGFVLGKQNILFRIFVNTNTLAEFKGLIK